MSRRLLGMSLLTIVVVLLIGGGLWLWLQPLAGQRAASGDASVPIGGAFSLVDQDGRRLTEADFRDKWMLVYFGYTWCPDACPLGLTTVAEALDQLPAGTAEQIQPVLISVDPERDTPAVLKEYVAAFHPRLLGLTGTPEEAQAAAKAWRVYARKGEPRADGGYLVDHSTFTYLMAPDGTYATHFGHDATPEAMAAKLQEMIAG